jgi:two-component system, sensor histidine kinase PdtaS
MKLFMIPFLLLLSGLPKGYIEDFKEDFLYQEVILQSYLYGVEYLNILKNPLVLLSNKAPRLQLDRDINKEWTNVHNGNIEEGSERMAIIQTHLAIPEKDAIVKPKEAKPGQQQNLQLLFIVFSGFLIIFLIIVYRLFLKQKKYIRILENLNREKEFLLKEIHHRVKNNLEIISSLLSLQTEHIADPGLLDIMVESQNRVQSMTMIHQKLYLGDNIAAIEMGNYFDNLGNYILNTFGATGRVKIFIDMNPLELDIDRAIPIGLIVNELFTNSMKYAFPANQAGEIHIVLVEKGDCLQLTFADNGIGIDPKPRKVSSGFGSQLIGLLCSQLKGKMVLLQGVGTRVFIEFQPLQAA